MPASNQLKIRKLLKRQKYEHELNLMYQSILEGIRKELNFNNFLKLVIQSVCKGLGFKRAGIFLVDPDGKSVSLAMGIDKKGRYEKNKDRIPIDLRPGQGHFSDIINGRKKFFYSNDVPRRMPGADFHIPVFNNALVPLQFGREKAIGAIAVDNLNKNRPITKADVIRLMNYATEVGLAIESFRSHERMVSLSFTDPMTGLYNRRFFDKALAQELSRAQRYDRFFSLLLIDIDHFKRVNDTYGHDAGDEILQQIAEILQSNIRSLDVVARIGGEEFAIILPETQTHIDVVVNRLLKEVRIAKPRIASMISEDQNVTISIGQASYQGGTLSAADLLKLADKSLYEAKRTGRDKAGPHHITQSKARKKKRK